MNWCRVGCINQVGVSSSKKKHILTQSWCMLIRMFYLFQVTRIFCLFSTLRIKKKQMSNNMKQIETDVHQVAIKYPS